MRSGEPYTVVLAPSAHRLYKKFDSALQEQIKEEARKVVRSSYSAPALHPPFQGLRSHHFRFCKAEYRIAYRIRARCKRILKGLDLSLLQRVRRPFCLASAPCGHHIIGSVVNLHGQVIESGIVQYVGRG